MLSGCAWRVVRRPAVCCQSSARVHAGASCELHVIISMIIRCVVHDFILAHGLVYVWQSNVPEDTCALGALAQRVTATASKLLAVLPGMISSPCFSVRHYKLHWRAHHVCRTSGIFAQHVLAVLATVELLPHIWHHFRL